MIARLFKKNADNNRNFLLFLLLVSPCLLAINSSQWLIKKIQVEDGLPDSTVFSVQQDQSGFMWFGTTSGLARYDGYSFKVFKHEGTDSNTISNNNAGNIFIDSKNTLWIGTFGGGVNKLNLNTGKLERLPYSNSKINEMVSENVQTFFEDKDSNIWIGTSAGIYKLNEKELVHFDHELNNDNSLIHSRIWDILADDHNSIWIGTSEGLSQLNPQTGNFNNYLLPEELTVNITSNQFRKLLIIDNTLWIGSSTGLFSFDIETKQFSSHSSEIKINDIYPLDQDHFLIASMDGLYHFDLISKQFTKNSDGQIWQSLNHIDIRSILLSRSGMLWFATRDKGVIKIDQTGGLFKHHDDYVPDGDFREESKQIWALKFDSQGNFFLATSEMLFKRNNEELLPITTDDFDYVPGIIRDIKLAQNNGMWIAGSEGLFFLEHNQTKAQVINEPFDLVGIKPTDIFSVEETKSGEIWLALYNIGVLHWDPQTSTAELIQNYQGGSLTNLNILDIYQDTDENIWIASYITGLFRYNTKNNKIELFKHDYNDINSISSNRVRDIYQDSTGRIWIATARGLNLFNKKSNSFKRYMKSDGLLNNSVYSITEDSKQNLWLSYNFGISRFNPTLEEITNYWLDESIKFDGLNPRAATIDKNDTLYLGSSNGFYTFNPTNLISNIDHTPQLNLTKVTINNKPLSFELLSSNQNRFELKPNDQVISFDFTALEYKTPEQVQYNYRMVGLQKNWYDVTVSRHIELNNLNPGNYHLEIKATNNDGRWAKQTLNIHIIVHPVWWKIGWVRILFVLLGTFIALALHYYRTHKIKSRNQSLESEVKNRTSELLALNEKLKKASRTDYLTGLNNRMGFFKNLKKKQTKSIGSCLVLADIDNFKSINDMHSHSAGDKILKKITQIMQSYTQKNDLIARWGGEEFIFYFENKNEKQTYKLIESLRTEIQNKKINYKGQVIQVTCTFGICQRKANMSIDNCINAADKAMYVGKSQDRNRVIISNQSE